MVAHGDILPLPHSQRGVVASGEILHEGTGIRTRDLDLAFSGDIPHGHAVEQTSAFGGLIAIRRGHQHLVARGELGSPVGDRCCVQR